MRSAAPPLVLCLLLSACDGEESATPPVTAEQTQNCAETEVAVDGGCVFAGVPPDGCGEGFVHEIDGCRPLLPAAPCPDGMMALPGETTCREVAPCGGGTWGQIPTEGNTQHVDGSYAGTTPDGTPSDPWPTIAQAIQAAAPGAIVAVAEGDYAEALRIEGKPVRLWGRCPSLVSVQGPSTSPALVITSGGDGAEVRNIAITGGDFGIGITGASDVVLESLWAHDTAERAIAGANTTGPASFTVRGSLIERSSLEGIDIAGVSAVIEDTVVRSTRPLGDDGSAGVRVTFGVQDERASLDARRVVVVDNVDHGILIASSDALIEDALVADTQPVGGAFGYGIGLGSLDIPSLANLRLNRAVLARNHEASLFIGGADVVADAVTIIETKSEGPDSGVAASIQLHPTLGKRSSLMLSRSLLANNVRGGLRIIGSDVGVEASAIRDNGGLDEPRGGTGIHSQLDPVNADTPSSTTVTTSRIENNQNFGLSVIASQASIARSRIRGVLPDAAGEFGDGVMVASGRGVRASASMDGVDISDSARAGIGNFGGDVNIVGSAVNCNPIDLDGEQFEGFSFAFQDDGNNTCGCAPTEECRVVSSNMTPPPAL